jgi:chromate transporter
MNGGTLLQLIVVFGSLSLLSFGGTSTVLPEMHRQAVTVHHWLTDLQFASVFAISQASPGPSSLIVSLIGLKAAGWVGVLVATVAMFIPSAVLTFAASLAWERFRDAKWRIAAEKGLAPITVGLLLASGLVITRAADHGWSAFILTGATTILLVTTRVNPLFVMVAAGILSGLGLVK